MPSEIRYKGESGSELLSYCKESAQEVLSRIFQTHCVAVYKGVAAPVGSPKCYHPTRVEGLMISDVEEREITPTGTFLTIESTLDDVDMDRARLESPTTPQEVRYGVRLAIEYNLDNANIRRPHPSNYLDTRPQGIEEQYEEKLKALLEVAKVALDVSDPSPDTLKEILGEC